MLLTGWPQMTLTQLEKAVMSVLQLVNLDGAALDRAAARHGVDTWYRAICGVAYLHFCI